MTRYRVCGTREVLGHQPGEEFDAAISEIQEQRLTDGGHIERVDEASESHDEAEPDVNTGDSEPKE